MKEKIPEELRKEFEQAVLNADEDHWAVDNDRQFLDKIWDAVDKLFNQEVEKQIAERMPTKEVIVQYFNNHFDCHTDVIIGDYETNEIAMTSTAVLKLFNWLRSRLTNPGIKQKSEADSRYQMTKDQPSQIDCRVTICKYYKGAGKCNNVSPAITLNLSGTFNCWSMESSQKTEGGGE